MRLIGSLIVWFYLISKVLTPMEYNKYRDT